MLTFSYTISFVLWSILFCFWTCSVHSIQNYKWKKKWAPQMVATAAGVSKLHRMKMISYAVCPLINRRWLWKRVFCFVFPFTWMCDNKCTKSYKWHINIRGLFQKITRQIKFFAVPNSVQYFQSFFLQLQDHGNKKYFHGKFSFSRDLCRPL